MPLAPQWLGYLKLKSSSLISLAPQWWGYHGLKSSTLIPYVRQWYHKYGSDTMHTTVIELSCTKELIPKAPHWLGYHVQRAVLWYHRHHSEWVIMQYRTLPYNLITTVIGLSCIKEEYSCTIGITLFELKSWYHRYHNDWVIMHGRTVPLHHRHHSDWFIIS